MPYHEATNSAVCLNQRLFIVISVSLWLHVGVSGEGHTLLYAKGLLEPESVMGACFFLTTRYSGFTWPFQQAVRDLSSSQSTSAAFTNVLELQECRRMCWSNTTVTCRWVCMGDKATAFSIICSDRMQVLLCHIWLTHYSPLALLCWLTAQGNSCVYILLVIYAASMVMLPALLSDSDLLKWEGNNIFVSCLSCRHLCGNRSVIDQLYSLSDSGAEYIFINFSQCPTAMYV